MLGTFLLGFWHSNHARGRQDISLAGKLVGRQKTIIHQRKILQISYISQSNFT